MLNLDSSPRKLQANILRIFFAFSAASAVLGVVNTLWGGFIPAGLTRIGLTSVYAIIGVLSLAAMRLSFSQSLRALTPLVFFALLAIGCTAFVSGWGLRTPGFYFFGIVCCMTATVAPRRDTWIITLSSTSLVLLLGGAEYFGLHDPPAGPNTAPLGARMGVLLFSIAVGAGAGRMLSLLTQAHVREVQSRESRFRALLAIAASAYWETDEHLRVVRVSFRNGAGNSFDDLPIRHKRPAWEITRLVFDRDVADRLKGQMLTREPIRDVPMRWHTPEGLVMMLLVSGEPRADEHKPHFIGYWGVARDVTAEHLARAALLDTELRYRDLFRRTPTPMVLHRDGLILDANDAAARMFGLSLAQVMIGRRLFDFYEVEDLPKLESRLQVLNSLPVGEALPLADFSLVQPGGKRVWVKATGVRSDIGGRQAMLSIYVDETEQRAAALAQQRSEALLRQVVTMSPDVITLTDLDHDCYEMVNDSFTRVTGYPADEVLGLSEEELGIWATPEDRTRLMARLADGDEVKDMAAGFVHRDGRWLPMLVSASRFGREGRSYLVINARDMSDANRERLEREAIMANASVGLAHTRERRFLMANPRWEQMFGWSPGSLVGQPGRVVWPSDSDYEAVGHDIAPRLAKGQSVEFERMAQRRDGGAFLVRMRASPIDPRNPADGGTIWVAEDVTAQREAEAELARARDAAEAANLAKSAFLANTSHEIRTPLNGLVGLARMARQPDLDPHRLRQYLEQIGTSAEGLSLILSDILDLSKIEAGRLELTRAPFDLHELLHSLRSAWAALADGRGLTFALEMDPHLPEWVRGDSLRVRQILTNYLNNALKFTTHGSVRLCARVLEDDLLRFEVIDTGPGIDEATQSRLFKPFTQADESITRRFGGTGLGLSISHELALLMGGRVGLRSTMGEGSVFHVELPLPAVPADTAQRPDTEADQRRLRGARVLLVEDNPVNMLIGVALLEQWGMVVEQAEDGMLALAAIERASTQGRPFDVVLMDVQMPGISGYETTRRVRESWTAAQLPVIALTAAALVSERERALASGMNDFVTKPIEADRLRSALARVLPPHRS